MQWISGIIGGSKKGIDVWLIASLIPIVLAGIVTLMEFGGPGIGELATRQMVFIAIGFIVMIAISRVDPGVLYRSKMVLFLYLIGLVMLILLIPFGETINGARSWFDFGIVSFQPSDLVKLMLVIILSKYLAHRHIEIKRFKHIFITFVYLAVPFLFIFFQPDFGSAFILIAIWIGMILAAGIPFKYMITLVFLLAGIGGLVYVTLLEPYQQERIVTFFQSEPDEQGSGYNSRQSMIAVGSGQLFGKGLGYGTQSRLQFLPEHETDFIFASFAEEWGFIGSLLLLFAYASLIARILQQTKPQYSNFSRLYAVGLSTYFVSHAFINIGMNIDMLPVTGITLPFMSAGGSHIIAEFAGLGVLLSLGKSTSSHYIEGSEMTMDELV